MPSAPGDGGLQTALDSLAQERADTEAAGARAEERLSQALTGFVRRAREARICPVPVRLEPSPREPRPGPRSSSGENRAWVIQPHVPPPGDEPCGDLTTPLNAGIYVLESGELCLTDCRGRIYPQSSAHLLRISGLPYFVASLAAFLASHEVPATAPSSQVSDPDLQNGKPDCEDT